MNNLLRNTAWWIAFGSAMLMFAFLVPPFQNPDEPAHLAYSMKFAQKTSHPETLEKSILLSLRRCDFWRLINFPEPPEDADRFYEVPLLRMKPTQSSKPLLFYKMNGIVLAMLHITDPVNALQISRLVCWFISMINAWMFLRIFGLFRMKMASGMLAMCLVLSPQFVCMSSSVNPAGLGWLASSIMIYGSLYMIDRKRMFPGFLWVVAGMILGMVTHRVSMTVAPVILVALMYLLTIRTKNSERTSHMRISLHGAISLILFSAIIAGTCIWPQVVRKLIVRAFAIPDVLGIELAPGASSLGWWIHFTVLFHKSVWLAFGWLRMYGDPWLYRILAVFTITSIAGLGIILIGKSNNDPEAGNQKWKYWAAVTAILSNVWFAAVIFAFRGEYSQGRYLFPSWPLICVILADGFLLLFPGRFRWIVSCLTIFGFIVVLLYSIICVLIPYCYL